MIINLLKSVFAAKINEKIAILYDVPKSKNDDTSDWKERRETAAEWHIKINKCDFKSVIASYDATYANNADLPNECSLDGVITSFDVLFSKVDIVIALTQFSATAPIHAYAKKYKIRAASMPGFNKKMNKALMLDFKEIANKVDILHAKLEMAESIDYEFYAKFKYYRLRIDLKGMSAIKDDGNCKAAHLVINLPSGEEFIAPNDGKDSTTEGYLPIEQNGKVYVFKIKKNHIIDCDIKSSPIWKRAKDDPAVGNIAEVAFGILCLYKIKPSGKTLLDEKLGPHIALGRCDHFGGLTGPNSFKKKENIWHQDFVYTKEMQPHIMIKSVKFNYKEKKSEIIIKDNKYACF